MSHNMYMNIVISKLIDDFLEHMEIEKNCSKLTIRDYRHYLISFNKWLSSTLPDKNIEDLDLATIRRYRVYLANRINEKGLTLTGTGVIHGIDIDLHEVGELTPSIAALAALADSPSHLRGIGHLRLHETDRLAALTKEINALGGKVEEHKTSLHITPAPLHGGVFHTYDDHRLATAGAVIGLVVPDIDVENIETTRKTLPDFPGLWSSLLV